MWWLHVSLLSTYSPRNLWFVLKGTFMSQCYCEVAYVEALSRKNHERTFLWVSREFQVGEDSCEDRDTLLELELCRV